MNICPGQGHEHYSKREGVGGYSEVGWVMVGSEYRVDLVDLDWERSGEEKNKLG